MDKIKRLLNYLAKVIEKNNFFYFSVTILSIISVVFVIHSKSSRFWSLIELFGDIYLLCALLLLIPQLIRRWVKYAFFVFLWLLAIVDMLCFLTMGEALSPYVLMTWLQTNSSEASEAFSAYFSFSLLFSPLSLLLLLPFVLLLLRKKKFSISRKVCLFLVPLTLLSAISGFQNKRFLYMVFSHDLEDVFNMAKVADSNTRDYLPFYRFLLSLKEIKTSSVMVEHIELQAQRKEVDSCSFLSPTIVLIIGESYNRHHSTLYGYEKNTTPLQIKRHSEGNLFRFNDVISSFNLTYKSFQNMFSFYDYGTGGKWFDYPLITPIFREAGYDVSFFSNQYCLNNRSSFSDFVEDVFINNKKLDKYLFDRRNHYTHDYDEKLIGDYKKSDNENIGPNRLVIFHFMGLHAEFNERYPKKYAVFDAADYQRNDISEEQKQVIAEYDNAIVYNDVVVDSIIKQFENQDAVVIYVPDHGELVYDNCQEFGRNMNLNKTTVTAQFDIPFWIFCSPLYMERHPVVCKQIEESVAKPFMTDDLPHLLVYLAGIHCKSYDERKNILSEKFNSLRKRLICGEIDYDKIYN